MGGGGGREDKDQKFEVILGHIVRKLRIVIYCLVLYKLRSFQHTTSQVMSLVKLKLHF